MRAAVDGHDMAEAPAYAESLYSQLESRWAPQFTWRTARFKFIDAPKPELRDLQKDPSETTNGVTDERVRAYDLPQSVASTLRAWVDRQLEPGDAVPGVTP